MITSSAPWAADPAAARRRYGGAPRPGDRRDAFQRDRDRIIHSISFRRLRHKTQVFIDPASDHARVRLTHSLEVAQIGRTIARALDLNEDLTEALCLAHDIGHPPFGHAGEAALDAALAAVGGFDHNGHTLRALTTLDNPYPLWSGLDLTRDTLEGLAKHNGPVAHPGWALSEVDDAFPLDLTRWPGLEAQVAAIADDIAYDNHDIDDGLRAGLLTIGQLLELPFVAREWASVCDDFHGVDPQRLIGELIRRQIGRMVGDVVEETRARLRQYAITSIDDVKNAGVALVGFAPALAADERALKAFLYENLYHHPRQYEAASTARRTINALFDAYLARSDQLPAGWYARLPASEPARSRHIGDYIAGMTDRYAAARVQTLSADTKARRLLFDQSDGA